MRVRRGLVQFHRIAPSVVCREFHHWGGVVSSRGRLRGGVLARWQNWVCFGSGVTGSMREVVHLIGMVRTVDSKADLRLSVLDQSPVTVGSTPADALQRSIELARDGDGLGDTRVWMSEHHARGRLGCTAAGVWLA